MKIRNRQSYINQLPEGEAPKTMRPKVTRWIYFLFLIFIVGYFIQHVFISTTTFEARGQVEINKTVISPLIGGQISQLNVGIGQRVEKGDVIAIIKPYQSCLATGTQHLNKAALDLAIKQSELHLLNSQYGVNRPPHSDNIIRRALEIDYLQSKSLKEYTRSNLALKYKISALKQEIEIRRAALTKNKNDSGSTGHCKNEAIRAPFQADIHSFSKKQFEYIHKGDDLVSLIPVDAAVVIEAYIENEDADSLEERNTLDIEFPNGEKSEGVITRISSSSSPFPSKEIKNYEFNESKVRIQVIPASEKDEKIWRSNDRMEVILRGYK